MSHSSPHPSLEQLQRWLQGGIMHPAGAEELPPGFAQLEDIVPPSSKQTSAERLGVYSTAYFLRLVDCLREFFPCLRFAMGDEVFGDFALAYLQQHPSQSYTLHRLADQFANFLAETSPSAGWEEFFVDLARLEHAIEVVFDAPGPEDSSPSWNWDPVGLTAQSTLSFVPGFQLLAFRYPVSHYYTAWKHDEQPRLPDPQAQWIALFRRDYIVRRHELSSLEHELLSVLQAGKTLEEGLSHIAPQAFAAGQTADTFAADLRNWFETWTRAEFFRPGRS